MGTASFCCSNLEDDAQDKQNEICDPAVAGPNQDSKKLSKVIRPTVLTKGIRRKKDKDEHYRPGKISDSDDDAE